MEHIRLWQATWAAGQKHFEATKKLYKSYFAGVPQTAEETLDCLAAARMRAAA